MVSSAVIDAISVPAEVMVDICGERQLRFGPGSGRERRPTSPSVGVKAVDPECARILRKIRIDAGSESPNGRVHCASLADGWTPGPPPLGGGFASCTRWCELPDLLRKGLQLVCVAPPQGGETQRCRNCERHGFFSVHMSLQVHCDRNAPQGTFANTIASHKRSGLPSGRTRREREVRAIETRSAGAKGSGRENEAISGSATRGASIAAAQEPPIRCRPHETRYIARRGD